MKQFDDLSAEELKKLLIEFSERDIAQNYNLKKTLQLISARLTSKEEHEISKGYVMLGHLLGSVSSICDEYEICPNCQQEQEEYETEA